MKNSYIVLCAILAVFFLAGCNLSDPIEKEPLRQTETDPSARVETQVYTEEDIIEIFNGEDSHTKYTSTGCVVVDDAAYQLIGVVQYTDEEGDPCNFAFVNKDGWSYPVGVAAEGGFSISNDSVFSYLGKGKIGFTLRENETQKVFDYTVGYSTEGSDTHFEVSSVERK